MLSRKTVSLARIERREHHTLWNCVSSKVFWKPTHRAVSMEFHWPVPACCDLWKAVVLSVIKTHCPPVFRHRSIMNLETVKPALGSGAWVAPNAAVVGDVKVGDRASVWYGSIVRGDSGGVTIGADSNIQDGCSIGGVITGFPQQSPTRIGDKVTVGHGAIISGCEVENSCLIGMGATLTPGCKISKGAIIAAGAVVHPNTTVPSGEVWAGNPATFLRVVKESESNFLPVSAKNYFELASEHCGQTKSLSKSEPQE